MKLKEIKEMLKSISPWPWHVEKEGGDRFIHNKDDERFLSDEIFEIQIPNTMEFISQSPQIISDLVSMVDKMKKSLEFYAEEDHYFFKLISGMDDIESAEVINDEGRKAREALKKCDEKK